MTLTATVASVSGSHPAAANDPAGHTLDVLPQGGLAEDLFRDGVEDL